MILRSVIVSLLALAVGGSIPACAGTRYRNMTVHVAAQLCQGARVHRQYRIAVLGFFRPRPLNHGPSFIGALFDSDTVPSDAAVHIAKYHAILFATSNTRKVAGSIDGITRPDVRVAVLGEGQCISGGMFPHPRSTLTRKLDVGAELGLGDPVWQGLRRKCEVDAGPRRRAVKVTELGESARR